MDDFSLYQAFKEQGGCALNAYLMSKGNGLDNFARIRMLRSVYGLSLVEANKVSFKGDTGEELEEQKDKLSEEFKKVLDDELGL